MDAIGSTTSFVAILPALFLTICGLAAGIGILRLVAFGMERSGIVIVIFVLLMFWPLAPFALYMWWKDPKAFKDGDEDDELA